MDYTQLVAMAEAEGLPLSKKKAPQKYTRNILLVIQALRQGQFRKLLSEPELEMFTKFEALSETA